MNVTIRRGRPEDAALGCGAICYEAFKTIARAHSFPPDMPSIEVATAVVESMFAHPDFYGVVALTGDRIVGSNFLDERNAISGIGPITVDPSVQNTSVGRQLMEAVLARAAAQGAPGVRLVQAAFHNRSLALYTKLGFNVREPLACMQGALHAATVAGRTVRPAVEPDVDACNRICHAVHGHTRVGELRDSIRQGTATVVHNGQRVTGYATVLGFFGHAAGESNADLQALIGAAKNIVGPGFLLPTRNAELFRWCLAHGLRVIQPMTLMSSGLYNDPAGAFLPSVTY